MLKLRPQPSPCALLLLPLLLAPALRAADAPAAAPDTGIAGEIRATIDAKADPCQDFYRYACGGWIDRTELPADKPAFGRGFTQVADRNQIVLRGLLEEYGKQAGGDAGQRKLGSYYAACMDEAAIERAGAAPLAPTFAAIEKVRDLATLMEVVGWLQGEGVEALLSSAVEGDFKNPDMAIAYLTQGGLGLIDRDYYLKDDEESKALRAEYQAHVGRMLALAGETAESSTAHAAAVVAFETELAKVSLSRTEMRDPAKLYNRIEPAALDGMTGGLSWAPFWKGLGKTDVRDLSAAPVTFFQGLGEAVRKTDLDTLRAYLRWIAVSSQADRLSKAFVDEKFAFFGRRLQGQKEIEARWKRCVDDTDRAMGFALGRAFVDRQFAGESKRIAVEMIEDIEHAFEGGLPQLAWMDDATRERAREKAGAVVNKVGYPDAWRDYSGLEVTAGDYFKSASAATRFEVARLLGKIGKPVDKSEWGMTPPTVNAYYNPLRNEMVFPAGVLQPPFFNKDFPKPMNFGGIGMAMGHELTHGFDDQGRQFDKTGQLREWWDAAVVGRFKERAECVAKLYDGFEVLPGLHLNGQLTLGENIADFGGVKAAFRGWRSWAARNGNPAPFVEGFTNDQLFFLGFAQSWCSVISPEFSRLLVTLDPHSPPRFRINGPLSHFPAFAEAFQCKAETPMNPATRCEVW